MSAPKTGFFSECPRILLSRGHTVVVRAATPFTLEILPPRTKTQIPPMMKTPNPPDIRNNLLPPIDSKHSFAT